MEKVPDIASLRLEAMDMMQGIEMGQAGFNAPQAETIQLGREQRQALDMVKNGKSIFFTGSAGSGKSVLLREIISYLRFTAKQRGWDNHSIAVTASTGIAAINIGGCTLHSWSGINLGKGPVNRLRSQLWASHHKRKSTLPGVRMVNDKPEEQPEFHADDTEEYLTPIERWRLIRVLIIDESK